VKGLDRAAVTRALQKEQVAAKVISATQGKASHLRSKTVAFLQGQVHRAQQQDGNGVEMV
jgi:hypothetical protein